MAESYWDRLPLEIQVRICNLASCQVAREKKVKFTCVHAEIKQFARVRLCWGGWILIKKFPQKRKDDPLTYVFYAKLLAKGEGDVEKKFKGRYAYYMYVTSAFSTSPGLIQCQAFLSRCVFLYGHCTRYVMGLMDMCYERLTEYEWTLFDERSMIGANFCDYVSFTDVDSTVVNRRGIYLFVFANNSFPVAWISNGYAWFK